MKQHLEKNSDCCCFCVYFLFMSNKDEVGWILLVELMDDEEEDSEDEAVSGFRFDCEPWIELDAVDVIIGCLLFMLLFAFIAIGGEETFNMEPCLKLFDLSVDDVEAICDELCKLLVLLLELNCPRFELVALAIEEDVLFVA